ncbi:hypothetical protein FQN50_000399 [Emmonsiellopsis sp. PD_5]|nr:hypothetical protein FQN50_000399 [Emmonsiellopsis sp. PD_5]
MTTTTNTVDTNNPMMMSVPSGAPGSGSASGSGGDGNGNAGFKTAPTMVGMEQRASQRASVIYEAP